MARTCGQCSGVMGVVRVTHSMIGDPPDTVHARCPSSAVRRRLWPARRAVLPVLLTTVDGAIHDVRDRQDRLGAPGAGHVREVGPSLLEQVVGVPGYRA